MTQTVQVGKPMARVSHADIATLYFGIVGNIGDG
jgi:hypothetical protein